MSASDQMDLEVYKRTQSKPRADLLRDERLPPSEEGEATSNSSSSPLPPPPSPSDPHDLTPRAFLSNMQASSSALPSYTSPSKDVISVVPSLSALHPDPLHPAHHALLVNLDIKKDSVKIFSFAQGGIVVLPEEVGIGHRDGVEEESWARVSGYIQVVSIQKKVVPRIRVKLVALQSLAFQQDRGGREEDEVFSKEIVLKDVQLEKGLNTFEFLLAVPHDAPVCEGSTVDNSSFANLKHYLIAIVEGGTKALFGTKDLVVEEPVWLAASPVDLESLSLNLYSENYTDELGAVSLDASSSSFTIAAPILVSLTLHSPAPALRVYAIKSYIDQTSDLTSFRDPAKVAQVKTKGSVFEHGWKGPYTSLQGEDLDRYAIFDSSVSEGTSWSFEEIGRVPTGRNFRASTYPQTKSSIRVSSELVVDLYFTLTPSNPSSPPSKVLIATLLRKSVFIGACRSIPGRLSLPDYSEDADAHPSIKVRNPCKCDEPFEKLREEELAFVRSSREGRENEPGLDASASRMKIGEAY